MNNRQHIGTGHPFPSQAICSQAQISKARIIHALLTALLVSRNHDVRALWHFVSVRELLGNAGSIISFRVGDAPYLVRKFQPRFQELDLLQLPNYRIYLKLMIDGTPSMPFSAATLKPNEKPAS